jgi:hypothetical protein
VVLIEGVARPLGVAALLKAADMLGPREWRGPLDEYMPGLGVTEGSRAREPFRFVDMGVESTGFAAREASDSGGDGGVASGFRAPDFE